MAKHTERILALYTPVVRAATLTLLFLAIWTLPAWGQTATATITWTDTNTGTANEDRTEIEEKAGTTGSYSKIADAPSNATSFQRNVPNPFPGGITYCYRLRAVRGTETSGYSNESCAMTPAVVAVTVPENVTVVIQRPAGVFEAPPTKRQPTKRK